MKIQELQDTVREVFIRDVLDGKITPDMLKKKYYDVIYSKAHYIMVKENEK